MKKVLLPFIAFIVFFPTSCSKNDYSKPQTNSNSSNSTGNTASAKTTLDIDDDITVIDEGDPTDVPNFFDNLVSYALSIAPPVNKSSLPKSYYFLTSTFPAPNSNLSVTGPGIFTFNVVCNDVSGTTFSPTIASASSNVNSASISLISESGNYIPSGYCCGGNYTVTINFYVNYKIGTVAHQDEYQITGVAGQTPVYALSQEIVNAKFSSKYNLNYVQPAP